MVIGVPSGIGDISWVYSKVKNIGEPLEIEVADGWPYRSVPYLELLPKVVKATYGGFSYVNIIGFQTVNGITGNESWYELRKLGDNLLLEVNKHLEAGKRLEKWIPDLPCDFHYEMITTAQDSSQAELLLEGLRKPVIGISAASYRGSEAWKTWGKEQWSAFLPWLEAETGGQVLLMGGFWDDLTSSLADMGYKDIVGRTNTGVMVELLRKMEGYLGFSSGLGVLRTVLSKPAFMMWPNHQFQLATSWAPFEMLEDKSYSWCPWLEVDAVQKVVRPWLRHIA